MLDAGWWGLPVSRRVPVGEVWESGKYEYWSVVLGSSGDESVRIQVESGYTCNSRERWKSMQLASLLRLARIVVLC